ncbi:MAG: ribonuclease E/G [Rhodospirillales bacterium]
MAKRMLIDATHPEETRVVVVNGTKLEEFDVEAASKRQLKGNIYLAKVTRVEPSLQAAFVDYGGNRHGFLAFSEIHPDYYQIPVADREALLEADQSVEAEEIPANSHAIDDGEVENIDIVGGDDTDEIEIESEKRRTRHIRSYKIQEVIKRRQILLVQVVKEERGNKGAALTTYLSLAGRYGVLMPNTSRGGGISRKITNAADRKRLKSIVSDLEMPEGMAVIIRTAGAERTKAEIRRDCDYLLRTWDEVRELTLKSTAPTLVYEEGSLIKRSLRDVYSKDIDEVVVEGDDGYKNAKDFMKTLMPSHAKKVKRYGKEEAIPLFQRFQIESQLDSMHQPTVQLKSGGYIVINPTEALVSIDVNSGRSTRERNIEETALRTNVEAAEEIARQLRLRDLSGLIVIDFIDMEENRNQHTVERKLKDAMRHDRARIQIGRISVFGLLELSRQRLRPSFLETSSAVCPHCGGSGHVRTIDSTALQMLRVLEEEGMKRRASDITITMPTIVALFLLNQKRAAIGEIEARYGISVTVLGDDSLIAPDHRIDRARGSAAGAGAGTVARPEEVESEEEEPRSESSDDGKQRPRRRRRRGGRQNQEADAGQSNADINVPVESDDEDDDDTDSDAEERTTETADGEERPRKRRRRGRRGGRRRPRRDEEEGTSAEASDGDSDDSEDQGEAATGEEPEGSGQAEGGTDEPAEIAGADVTDTDSAEEEAPKKRRRSRSRKKKTDGDTPDAAVTADAEAGQAAEEAPADVPAEASAEAEASSETADAEPAPEKPKRKRAPRKKPAAKKADSEPVAEVEKPAEESAPEPAPEAAAEVISANAAPAETAEEPSDEDTADTAPVEIGEVITVGDDEDDRPKRRGWWNRMVGK